MVGSPMVGGGPMVGGPMVGGGQGVRTYYISQEWTEAISCPSLGDTIHAGVLVYGGYNQWSVWAVTEGGGIKQMVPTGFGMRKGEGCWHVWLCYVPLH